MKIRTCFLISVLLGSGILSGCLGQNDDRQQGYNYVIISSSPDVYSEQIAESFKKVIEDNGSHAVIETPDDTSAESQIKILKKIKNQNIDCIAISANASSVYQKEMEEMVDRGVKVVAFDQIMQKGDGILLQVCAARLDKVGEMFLNVVDKNIDDEMKQVAILTQNNFQYNEGRYVKDIRRLLEKGAYPDIILTEVNYMNDDVDKCIERTAYLVERYPDLNVIFTTSTVSTIAVSEYLIEHNLSEDIKVIGYALPDRVLNYVGRENVCKGVLYCESTKLGKLTAYASMEVTEKGFSAESGSELETPDIGKYEVKMQAVDEGFEISVIYMQDSPNFMQ